jgi:methylisocitrate lyase
MLTSSGQKFHQALTTEKPLQIIGTINAYCAIMAQKIGFRALYLSGAGVSNASYGLPDLGLTTLDNVLEDARRIIAAVDLPLLVDIDTGWGNALMINRTIKSMISAGVAAVHIEDQVFEKRCGQLSGKTLVSTDEMVDRIKAAVDAKTDPHFFIMARLDGFTVEGLEKTIERALAYYAAGVDGLFAEAFATLTDYQALKNTVPAPILANLTEFGVTPLFNTQELAQAGVDMALYPLSASRAMNSTALSVFKTIREKGTQQDVLELMQTRQELYKFLNYDASVHHLTNTQGSNHG